MHNFARTLKQADIFYQFTTQQIELVAEICQEKEYTTGEIIFYERTKSDELYVIAEGVVDILVNPALVSDTRQQDLPAVTITTLRRGQSFGEIALVDRGLRSATAKVAQDSTHLIIIPRDKLIEICDSQPELGYRLMLNLAADLAFKIRSTDLRVREELLYGHERK